MSTRTKTKAERGKRLSQSIRILLPVLVVMWLDWFIESQLAILPVSNEGSGFISGFFPDILLYIAFAGAFTFFVLSARSYLTHTDTPDVIAAYKAEQAIRQRKAREQGQYQGLGTKRQLALLVVILLLGLLIINRQFNLYQLSSLI